MEPVTSRESSYTVAAVQWVQHGVHDRESPRLTMAANARRLAATIDAICATAETKPRILVFPALAVHGINNARRFAGRPRIDVTEVALDLLGGDPILTPIVEACDRHRCYFATSCAEKIPALPGRFFHTGVILGPAGLVLRSPKTQSLTRPEVTLIRDCFDAYVDALGVEAVLPVAETPLGRMACLVANEFLISESSRVLARKGVEIVLHPTAHYSGPDQPPQMALRQALAYTNGVYWISGALSREVTDDGVDHLEAWFAGGSAIVGPDGAVLGHIDGPDEGVVFARVDLGHLQAARERQARHTTPDESFYARIAGRGSG